MSIYGMYEEKDGPIYKVYNNVTPDLYTWKKYNHSLKLNEHNLLEMTIPLEDVTLQGTKNYVEQISEVVNRLQIRTEMSNIWTDSYLYCIQRNETCRD